MTPELITATAQVYATRWTKEDLLRLFQETTDELDRKTLGIAINIQNNVYGQQLALEI